jgi:hypothetical protein
MPKGSKKQPAASAALDRIVEAMEGRHVAAATRLGLPSIAEYVRELHRRHAHQRTSE